MVNKQLICRHFLKKQLICHHFIKKQPKDGAILKNY